MIEYFKRSDCLSSIGIIRKRICYCLAAAACLFANLFIITIICVYNVYDNYVCNVYDKLGR